MRCNSDTIWFELALNAYNGWRRFRAPDKKHYKPDYASLYRMPMHANSLRYAAQATR